MLRKALAAVWAFLISPKARRAEYALAIGMYEAIRKALGHP